MAEYSVFHWNPLKPMDGSFPNLFFVLFITLLVFAVVAIVASLVIAHLKKKNPNKKYTPWWVWALSVAAAVLLFLFIWYMIEFDRGFVFENQRHFYER